jgi:cytochrome P450
MDGKLERYDIKRHTIFQNYIEVDLQPSVKTAQGFVDDADVFIGAGYETSGHALSTATFRILNNTHVYKISSQTSVLTGSDPTLIPFRKEFENISYLHATVKEAVRMAIGVSMRLPRVNHLSPIQCRQWEIPPYTIISMAQRDVLFYPSIFTDP